MGLLAKKSSKGDWIHKDSEMHPMKPPGETFQLLNERDTGLLAYESSNHYGTTSKCVKHLIG